MSDKRNHDQNAGQNERRASYMKSESRRVRGLPADLRERIHEGPGDPGELPAVPADSAASGGSVDYNVGDGRPPFIEQVDQSRPCIIIGPARSGKTFFLLAIEQAIYNPRRDNLVLEFASIKASRPGAQPMSTLRERAIKIITNEDRDRDSTTEATDYSFELTAEGTVSNDWLSKRIPPETITVTVSDGPGGALFQDETNAALTKDEIEKWYQVLIPKARKASSLIFCVDATQPQLPILAKNLPKLIEDLTVVNSERQPSSDGHGILAWARSRSSRDRYVQRRRLNLDRFLLLLTKIDLLCQGRGKKPVELAPMIDPVMQVKRTLSPAILIGLHQMLKPGAQFAVGVTSALGFKPKDGEPLADENGFVRKGEGIETDEKILRAWTPFGVREAMFFIATGHAMRSVRLVGREDLEE